MAHDVSRQQMQAIKVAAVLHPLQPLGHPQLLQKDHRVNKMKALLCSLVLGLLVASQADAQIDASQVPGAFDRGLCLGGSLGVYPCACPRVRVPFEVQSCGSLSLAISLQFRIVPFTGSILAVCDVCITSAIYSLALMLVHCSY